MPDYSEFPTTPTAWQERALADAWQHPSALEVPEPPRRRRPDLVALVPGAVFTVLALVFLAGVTLPLGFLADGGLLWLLLVGAGVGLLVSELRKARRRR
ncbi:hypothetical protein SAMN04488107_0331 [Geodermatophilus saharensis]|uniref:Uncharacterized protein n=1 Tax=Geodermatophilus saharensis TaxID=1137994 RepID=A0A238ZVT2_9ACTN|nr:hypothetical protein [Geodermatophilus saharensis]SNR86773.1 hypothetical protein SAMN04488107_0331 [Geodermatophilus saharensis]